MKLNEITNESESSRITAGTEKSEGACTTCRKKVAQTTFDMLTGTYLPANPLISFATPQHPAVEQSNIDYEHKNVIDLLYGSIKGEKPLSYLNPCPKNDDIYRFPNDNKFIKYYYLPTTAINDDCIMILYVNYNYINQQQLPITIEINLKDCCKKLTEELWCASYDREIKSAYNNFIDCVKEKIWDTIGMNQNLPPYTPIDLINQIQNIEDNIKNDMHLLLDDDNLKIIVTGYRGKNYDSCLCPKYDNNIRYYGKPTHCCYPYDENGKKRPECWCPDGTLKNLCEDCEEDKNAIVEFPLPNAAIIFDKTGWNTCGLYIKDYYRKYDQPFKAEISYSIECNSGYSFKSEYKEISEFKQSGEFSFLRVIPIKVPKKDKCKITFYLKVGCNWCCGFGLKSGAHYGRQRVLKSVIENFEYNKFQNLLPGEKKKLINFDLHIDAIYGTDEFNKDCEECDIYK